VSEALMEPDIVTVGLTDLRDKMRAALPHLEAMLVEAQRDYDWARQQSLAAELLLRINPASGEPRNDR
jgi:hypothetical protein